jgi:hypothetical protein
MRRLQKIIFFQSTCLMQDLGVPHGQQSESSAGESEAFTPESEVLSGKGVPPTPPK